MAQTPHQDLNHLRPHHLQRCVWGSRAPLCGCWHVTPTEDQRGLQWHALNPAKRDWPQLDAHPLVVAWLSAFSQIGQCSHSFSQPIPAHSVSLPHACGLRHVPLATECWVSLLRLEAQSRIRGQLGLDFPCALCGHAGRIRVEWLRTRVPPLCAWLECRTFAARLSNEDAARVRLP